MSTDTCYDRRAIRRPRLWFVVVLAVLIVAAGWWPDGVDLVVTPRGSADPLLVVPLEPGERFTLRYTHSVDHAPIWEEHSIDRTGTIYVEEERFVMFGAGMGHWRGHGTLTRRGGYQVIQNIHYPIGEFVLRVGSAGVDHTLIWRRGRVNLSRLAGGQAVIVSARPARLWRRPWPRGVALAAVSEPLSTLGRGWERGGHASHSTLPRPLPEREGGHAGVLADSRW